MNDEATIPTGVPGVRRALGIDLGEVRIGVALSDGLGMLAHPCETIQVGGGPQQTPSRQHQSPPGHKAKVPGNGQSGQAGKFVPVGNAQPGNPAGGGQPGKAVGGRKHPAGGGNAPVNATAAVIVSAKGVSRVAEIAAREKAGVIIVGLPRNMDGTDGPAAAKARAFAEALQVKVGAACEVRLLDERLTTVAAQKALQASGRTAKDSRQLIDQVAAQMILQTYLDGEALKHSDL